MRFASICYMKFMGLKKLQQLLYLLVVAWMLGVSNVILEETRMVHETRAVIEHREEILDTNLNEDTVF